jgi:hypothetical protein
MRNRKPSGSEKPKVKAWLLPAHWPRYATEEYYSWSMERMPEGAIPADWSKHRPHNSYGPLFWYQDKTKQCRDCGVEFVFSKEEQKHWYEDLKIPIYADAVSCKNCRAKIRAEKAAQKEHMNAMALVEPHPNEAFFRRKT